MPLATNRTQQGGVPPRTRTTARSPVARITAIDFAAWAEALALIGVAVVEADLKGQVASWNDAAEAIYGWSAEEAIGRPILELIIRPEHADAAIALQRAAMTGDTWSGQVLGQCRDGSLVHIRAVITARHGPDNEINGTIGVSVAHAQLDTAEIARTAELLEALVDRLASSTQQVRQATTPTVAGLGRLSPREQEVLALLRQGLRVPTVAERLSVSQYTVRNQLRSIFRKLDVNSQRELLDRFVPDGDQ
jgi:PAS domain S-box-containing protein